MTQMMKLLTSCLLLACLVGCNEPQPVTTLANPAHKVASGEERTYLFRYQITNPQLTAVVSAGISVALPLSGDGQELLQVDSTLPYQRASAEGSEQLRVELGRVPALAQRQLQLKVQVRTGEERGAVVLTTEQRARYLQSEVLVERDDPTISALAAKLRVKGNELATAKAIYQWVQDNLHYTHNSPVAHGAKVALVQRSGDCTEYMHLVMALARATGIPARAASGYVYSQNGVVNEADYHDWAELYLNGRWQLVDGQHQRFMEHEADYLTMQRGRPIARFSIVPASLGIAME